MTYVLLPRLVNPLPSSLCDITSGAGRSLLGGTEDIPEQDVDEDPDRLHAPRGLGPQDRTLPTAQAELGELDWVEVGPDLAGVLGGFQALRIPIPHPIENFLQ